MFSIIDFIELFKSLEFLPDGIENTIFEILQFISLIIFGEVHTLPVL